jgi:crotonobetainyl-CoA:carnitine CoA-transferase CaiB-like acyl-CoA transferase
MVRYVHDHATGGDQPLRDVGNVIRCAMKGTLQKKVSAFHLACFTCRYFREDDPDLFYCLHHRDEFPALCDQFQKKEINNVDVSRKD